MPRNGKALNLVNRADKTLPGPTIAKAKAGQKQKATTMAHHRLGGVRGSTTPSPKGR